MTDDDWPYDEQGFPRKTELDIDWFLGGAGLDSEEDVFTEDDLRAYLDVDFIEYDDRGRVIVPTKTLECGCNPRAMLAGAHSLAEYLASRPLGFPRDIWQIDTLRQFHTENTPWRKWVDPKRSDPSTGPGHGTISLWGCHRPGHHFLVGLEEGGTCSVTGVDLESLGNAEAILSTQPAGTPQRGEIAIDDEDLPEALEREEQAYDARTFGHLDVAEVTDPVSSAPDPRDEWQDSGFTAQDVQTFIAEGISRDEVLEMAQVMAMHDVAKWVKRFKEDWRHALTLYVSALGREQRDGARTSIADALAESIRMAVHSALRKSIREGRADADTEGGAQP